MDDLNNQNINPTPNGATPPPQWTDTNNNPAPQRPNTDVTSAQWTGTNDNPAPQRPNTDVTSAQWTGTNDNSAPQRPNTDVTSAPRQQQPYAPQYFSGQSSYSPPPPQQPGQNYQWSFDNMQQQAQQAPPPARRKNKGLRVFGILVACIALVVMGGFAVYGGYVAITGNTLEQLLPNPDPANPNSPSSLPGVDITDRPATGDVTVADGGMTNTDIFNKVSPSVVGVVSYVTVGNGYFDIGEGEEQGSGIIMSSDGYIITNEHVVSNASRIEVVMDDGKTYAAELVGGDIQTDLAVLKIDATDLPAAEFGNSEQLQVGERVVAIGNPGGLQFANSLTVGYVSALGRILSTGEVGYALECIQTDAAINPGNSGGALINGYGQVIGINSAKMRTTENYEGMGFAIPINDAKPILDDIIKNGKVTGRAMLGITAGPVTATTAQTYNIPMGLMIESFTEDSDLPGKGVLKGDIVTHINNIPIYTTNGSSDILKDFKPGDTVTLSIYRRDTRGRAGSFNIDVVLVSS